MTTILTRIAATLLSGVFLCSACFGQNSDPASSAAAAKIRPESDADAFVDLLHPDKAVSGRQVALHRELPPRAGVTRFFHRPILALHARPEGRKLADWATPHPWIWTVSTNSEGVCVSAVVAITSVDFRNDCLRVAAIATKASNMESINVERWPLTELFLEAATKNELFRNIKESQRLAGTSIAVGGERAPVTLCIPEGKMGQFLAALESGDLWLYYRYAFTGAKESGSVVTSRKIEGKFDLRSEAKARLKPAQADGTEPIFLSHVNSVSEQVGLKVSEYIKATSKDLIALVQSSKIANDLFKTDEKPLDQIRRRFGDSEFDRQIAEYLRPIVNEIEQKNEKKNETTSTSTDENELEVHIGGQNAPAGATVKKKNVEELKRTAGVTATALEKEKKLIVNDIQVFVLKEGQQILNISEDAGIFLSDRAEQYLEEPAVSPRLIYESMTTLFPGKKELCSTCKGFGKIKCDACMGVGSTQCDSCHGKGLLISKKTRSALKVENCPRCGGNPVRDLNGVTRPVTGFNTPADNYSQQVRNALEAGWRPTGGSPNQDPGSYKLWVCSQCNGGGTKFANDVTDEQVVEVCPKTGCKSGSITCSKELNGFRCNAGFVFCADCKGSGFRWAHLVSK